MCPEPGRQPGGDLLPNLAVPMATLFYSILLPKLLVGFPTVTQAGGPASSQCISKTYFCNPSMHPLQQLTSFLGGLPNLLVVCSARLCI